MCKIGYLSSEIQNEVILRLIVEHHGNSSYFNLAFNDFFEVKTDFLVEKVEEAYENCAMCGPFVLQRFLNELTFNLSKEIRVEIQGVNN